MIGRQSLEAEAVKAFEPEAKIGLIATINPVGEPHLTLISSIRAKTPTRLTWGQFSEGLSKVHVRANPQTGFLVLTMDKRLWRGKARWTEAVKQGEDYDLYNNLPMFRYNAYFGIHTVHYMDMVETYGEEKLPLARIVWSTLLTAMARGGARTRGSEEILKPWGRQVFNAMDALKFLSYVGPDGFPVIIPLLQCQATDSRRLVFSTSAYKKELAELKAGATVAVFGLKLTMEDVLVRGVFQGFQRTRSVKLGTIDLNWVYNSMPPKQGQVYPMPDLAPVVSF